MIINKELTAKKNETKNSGGTISQGDLRDSPVRTMLSEKKQRKTRKR